MKIPIISNLLSRSVKFYLGPESIMPLASILAAVVGFILIFWRYIVKFFKKILGKSKPADDVAQYIEPENEDQDKPGSA